MKRKYFEEEDNNNNEKINKIIRENDNYNYTDNNNNKRFKTTASSSNRINLKSEEEDKSSYILFKNVKSEKGVEYINNDLKYLFYKSKNGNCSDGLNNYPPMGNFDTIDENISTEPIKYYPFTGISKSDSDKYNLDAKYGPIQPECVRPCPKNDPWGTRGCCASHEEYLCVNLKPSFPTAETASSFKIQIPSIQPPLYGMLMGFSSDIGIESGVVVKVLIADITADQMNNIWDIAIVDKFKTFNKWVLSDAQIDLLFRNYCSLMSKGLNNCNGLCPFNRSGAECAQNAKTELELSKCSRMSKCPQLAQKRDSVSSGFSICDKYAKLSTKNQDYIDGRKISFCEENKQEYICDCISAPAAGSYYYKVYKQIVDNAGLPLSGDACWFAPCRDSTDRLRTKLIIDTTTKEGACPVPQCANVCIGCTANDKNIINQYCKIV
ncbi:MAG: hypothetical protein AABY22_27580, partial [Nanoarchaeota archaeon]